MAQPAKTCAHCGRPISGRGPTPAAGLRYCARPECQRVADRSRRQPVKEARQRLSRDIRRQQRESSRAVAPRGALPPSGHVVGDDDGERIQCHECGRFYAGLNHHVRMSHHMSADLYREKWGLARGQSLSSPASQARQRIAYEAKVAAGLLSGETLAANPRRAGTPNRLQSRLRSSVGSARREA